MRIPMLLCLCCVSGQADFQSRVDLMAFHVERLQEITVPANLEGEKTTRLAGLQEKVKAGVATEDEYKTLYYAIDEVRQWLWNHAAQPPQTAPGEFQESDTDWTVTTPELALSLNKKTLGIEVVAKGHHWRFADGGQGDLRYAGESLSLCDAKRHSAEALHPGYAAGMSVTLSDLPKAPGLTLILNAEIIGTEIVFEVVAQETGTGFERLY